jgi:hypothetical protein
MTIDGGWSGSLLWALRYANALAAALDGSGPIRKPCGTANHCRREAGAE